MIGRRSRRRRSAILPPIPITDLLEQGADAQVMRVEEGRTVQAGLVADDVVTEAMASIKRLAELDEGPDGPFNGDLTHGPEAGDPGRADHRWAMHSISILCHAGGERPPQQGGRIRQRVA